MNVPEVGLEPTRLTAFDLKSNVATITPPRRTKKYTLFEAWAGFAPAYSGFADRRVDFFATRPLRHYITVQYPHSQHV